MFQRETLPFWIYNHIAYRDWKQPTSHIYTVWHFKTVFYEFYSPTSQAWDWFLSHRKNYKEVAYGIWGSWPGFSLMKWFAHLMTKTYFLLPSIVTFFDALYFTSLLLTLIAFWLSLLQFTWPYFTWLYFADWFLIHSLTFSLTHSRTHSLG